MKHDSSTDYVDIGLFLFRAGSAVKHDSSTDYVDIVLFLFRAGSEA